MVAQPPPAKTTIRLLIHEVHEGSRRTASMGATPPPEQRHGDSTTDIHGRPRKTPASGGPAAPRQDNDTASYPRSSRRITKNGFHGGHPTARATARRIHHRHSRKTRENTRQRWPSRPATTTVRLLIHEVHEGSRRTTSLEAAPTAKTRPRLPSTLRGAQGRRRHTKSCAPRWRLPATKMRPRRIHHG
jgi:hypothetical protein